MDIKEAQRILQQAEAAQRIVARHREQQLRNAYRKFEGFSSNEELIAALRNLSKEQAKSDNKSGKRSRARITADAVNRIKSLANTGQKGAAITRQVEASYATVLKVLKGKYDQLVHNVPEPPAAPKPQVKRKRRTNNVKLSDLTETEIKAIKKAKSHKDILKLPKGTKNGGKNVMYAVFASVKGLDMRKGKNQ